MMRGLVIALALANLLALAWSVDLLPGFTRGREREPERQKQEVRPDAVQLISPTAASAALQAAAVQRLHGGAVSGPEASECLEAGPLAASEVAAAERALRALDLPSLQWTQQRSERGGSFIVYLGRFADDAALARRRDELRRQQLVVDEVRNAPDLQPGLQFGRFDTRAAADAAQAQLVQQGVKAARVVTVSNPVVVTQLRVERADSELAARLKQLSLPPAGAGFRPCAVAQ